MRKFAYAPVTLRQEAFPERNTFRMPLLRGEESGDSVFEKRSSMP